MAVYTEIPDGELSAFIAEYDIGALKSAKGIAEGVENSNYLLHAGAGTYILTLYEKRVQPEDLPFFLGLMQHLSKKGVNCPLPVADRKGRTLKSLAGRPAALVTFLEGMWIRRPTPDHCGALGRAMAEMHLAARGFDMRRENALSVGGWRPLFEKARADADSVATGLADEIDGEFAHLERNWPKALVEGIIHADLFPDNVFFLGNKVSGIIDFYFACNDTLAYDIAICINAWCFEADNSFNITKARALLSGYSAVRRLEPDEFDALPLLARGAALRFLLTRLYDWLNTAEGALVKPKDPREYLRRLRFHRSVASAREYGLDHA
ncbi:MAG: homoserine kinase [Hyphomicrobiales bacterium]|nr:homoserine kinase [Hyphomicrobiales bacterium]